MKKIIFLLLFYTSIFAQYKDAKYYIGVDAGYFNENFTQIDAKNSTTQASLKIGYGVIDAYAIEFSFDWVQNDSKIFSQKDGDKYDINVELVKAFDIHKYLKPFFKVGFGAGRIEIKRELQDKLNFGSFNLGIGTFIPLSKTFDIEIGYKYRYLTYEKIDLVFQSIAYKSHVNVLYSGINVRF